MDLTNELVLEEQTEKENAKRKKRMEMKFPRFDPDLATLDLDPPNIFTHPSKKKEAFKLTHPFLPYSLSIDSQLLQHSYE